MTHVFRITIEEASVRGSFDDALRDAMKDAERIFTERFGIPRVVVEYLGDNLQDEPAVTCRSVSRDWDAEGVFWSGTPGDTLERVDDMSDYGGEGPVFDGDMAAALHVARNGFPWVLYEHGPRWTVTAYPTREQAERAVLESKFAAFAFDGRRYEQLEDRDGGYGFAPPPDAITNAKVDL